MTVSTTICAVLELGNGVTTTFNYGFTIPYQADGTTPAVRVTVIDVDSVATILGPVDYDITGVGLSGGTVIYTPGGVVAPLPSGWSIFIERDLDYDQPTAVSNQSFLPHTVELMGDREVLQIQQIARDVGYAVRVPAGEAGVTVPPKALRVNAYFGWDATGQPIAIAGIISSVAVSVFMRDVVAAPDADTAKALLDIEGSTSGTNAKLGHRAGEAASGGNNVYVGEAAGFGAVGSNGVYIGAAAGEAANGQRNVYISPIAMRYRAGNSGVGIGYAAGENVDGDRHIFIGDHAGAPPYTQVLLTGLSTNPATNIVTSNPPMYAGVPVTLVIGKTYRLQFENGGGTAPLPLASVSTLAICQTVGATVTWLVTSYDITTAGSGAYVAGLCYYHWDDLICLGATSPDGPNQTWIGFDNSREFLPSNDGLTSLGRSPLEAATYGTRGQYRWRGICARYMGVWANGGEEAFYEYGIAGVRRWSSTVDTSGNFSHTRYNNVGVALGQSLVFNNATGNATFSVQQGAGQSWTAAVGTPSKGVFDTATATATDCAQRIMALEQLLVQMGLKNA